MLIFVTLSDRLLLDVSLICILNFSYSSSYKFMGRFVQVEIIKDLPADKTITVYRCGPLVDLCRGPHIPNTSFVKALACLKVMHFFFAGRGCLGCTFYLPPRDGCVTFVCVYL